MRHNLAIKGTRNYGEADGCEVPYHGNKRTEAIIPILTRFDFGWTAKQMDIFVMLWEQGKGLPEIAAALKRHEVEAVFLLIQLTLDGMVKAREGGLLGL